VKKNENNPKRPKIGLALGGGSALGSLHIGVLQALYDNDIPIDCISGTSAGAMIAACYAFGVPIKEMIAKTTGLSWYGLSSFIYPKLGLVSNMAAGKLLEDIIGKVNIEDADIPLAIIATNIETGEKTIFRKGNVVNAVRASTCIPGLFVPVELDGVSFVDGGLVENVPLSPLKDMGAEVRIGVNLDRWHPKGKPKNVVDVLISTMDVIIGQQESLNLQNSEILIEPHLEKYSLSDFKKSGELIDEGYRATTLMIPEIRKFIPESLPKKPIRAWERVIKWLLEPPK